MNLFRKSVNLVAVAELRLVCGTNRVGASTIASTAESVASTHFTSAVRTTVKTTNYPRVSTLTVPSTTTTGKTTLYKVLTTAGT